MQMVSGKGKVTAPTGKSVNFREQPTSQGKLIARIPLGETVEVFSISGEWAHIGYHDIMGYMMVKFIEQDGAMVKAEVHQEDAGKLQDLEARLQELEARIGKLESMHCMDMDDGEPNDFAVGGGAYD